MTTSKLKTAAVVLLAVIGLSGAGAATAWACGILVRPTVPPVSAPKPFPFESVETRLPKSDDPPAVWEKPVPKALVAAGADKPSDDKSAATAGVAKSATFVMTNPAKDITVVSDRHETLVEFFRRQPVLVAHVPENVRAKMLHDAKGSNGLVFVDSASFNVDGLRTALYGASVKLAPVTFDGPAFHLLEMTDAKHPVIFVRDPADKELWHAAGFTKRQSMGFFADTKKAPSDDFAPADLLEEKPEKKDAPKKELKPTRLINPGKDIFLISDRDETIPKFFHRQTVWVGGADAKTVELLAQGKGTPDKVFINYTRANDDEQRFGSTAKVATPAAAVAELIAERLKADAKAKDGLIVILLPDAKDKDVFHVVGFTLHTNVRFFEIKEPSDGDYFSPADLLKPKK